MQVIWILSNFAASGNILAVSGRQSLLFTFFLSEAQSFLPEAGVSGYRDL